MPALRRLTLLGLPGSGKGTYGSLLSRHLKLPILTASSIMKLKMTPELTEVTRRGGLVPDAWIGGVMKDAVISASGISSGGEVGGEGARKNYKQNPHVTVGVDDLSFEAAYILDGYPRTRGQGMQVLDEWEEVRRRDRGAKEGWSEARGSEITHLILLLSIARTFFDCCFAPSQAMRTQLAVFIDVPKEVVLAKLSGRMICVDCGKGWNDVAVDEAGFNMPAMLPSSGSRTHCECGGCLRKRGDDTDSGVVEERLRVYGEATKPVIDLFAERGKLITFIPYQGVADIDKLFTQCREEEINLEKS